MDKSFNMEEPDTVTLPNPDSCICDSVCNEPTAFSMSKLYYGTLYVCVDVAFILLLH